MYKIYYDLLSGNILTDLSHDINVTLTGQHKNYTSHIQEHEKNRCVLNIWNSIKIETINCRNL